jgi:hypothetical protein
VLQGLKERQELMVIQVLKVHKGLQEDKVFKEFREHKVEVLVSKVLKVHKGVKEV